MGFKFFLGLLCLKYYFNFCLGKDSINVGVFLNSYQVKSGINWNILKDRLNENIEFSNPSTRLISETDGYAVSKALCDVASQEGISAVFGPESIYTSDILESVCSHLGISYILTSPRPRNVKESDLAINLFPEASLLAQGYAAIVQSLNWDSFVVLYEDEESLLKLQDVLKLQEYNKDNLKNSMILRMLNKNWDNRSILKQLKSSTISRVILDCKTDKIMDILFQAIEVNFLTDFTTSFFLTSLDAHTLDFSILNTKANITTARLFNPFQKNFERYVNIYFPETTPEKILIDTALMHDAMLLLAQAVNFAKSALTDSDIIPEVLLCNSSKNYKDKYEIAFHIKEINLTDSLTGSITLKNGKRQNFQLDVIEVDKPKQPIGIWNAESPSKFYLTRNATEREAELQKRLESHNFIVTSRIGGPYLFETQDSETSGNARYYGYSMDLIAEIAKLLNITFEFRITKDNSYANLAQDLIDRRADLAICDFTITPQRREIIDFSMPFMNLGIGILHKKSEQEEVDNMYGFLGPLSTIVWFYIGALYLFMSFVLVLIARMSTEDWENPHPCDQNPHELENIWNLKNCCWLTLGSICTQGCDILPKGICSRLATASWWFFSLIITSSYTANLAAFLTMSKKDDSIKSVEDLAKQSKVKYGLLKGGSTGTFFASSNNTLYQRMWNTMSNEKPSVFEASNQKGVERILSTKNSLYAFFMESTGIEYELEKKCMLRRIGNLLDSKSYGIGIPMNAEYRHSINAAVLKLQETGKLNELKEKWWKKEREGDPCPVDVPDNSDALALANVGGVFVVLGVCIVTAFLIAILEFLWNVFNLAVEERITYIEALKIELKFACNVLVTKKRVKPIVSESTSSKSDEDPDEVVSKKGILINAGSLLNVSPTISNRIGSSVNSNTS